MKTYNLYYFELHQIQHQVKARSLEEAIAKSASWTRENGFVDCDDEAIEHNGIELAECGDKVVYESGTRCGYAAESPTEAA